MGVSIWSGDLAQELVNAVYALAGQYDTTSARSIVSAIRSGNIDKIPNGSVFTERHAVYGDVVFVTRAKNQHKVAGDPTRPTITIQPLYLLSTNGTTAAAFQYDRAEAFASVDETISAGTVCKFNLPATTSGWIAGDYYFTATGAIPAGSKLLISGNYTTALTSLNVAVYANAKATSASANYPIYSGDGGSGAVDLGALNGALNHVQRISYGSNNDAESNLFQFLNGDSGTGYMDSVFTAKTKFDMMSTSFTSLKGYLGGFSDEFRSYLGLCAIPNIMNTVYTAPDSEYAVNTDYTYNGYFFLPSRKEIYGTNETAKEDDETQFNYFSEIGTKDADKLMYAKNATSPTTYWLRTPNAGAAGGVRICYAAGGGSLYSSAASDSHGVAPLGILA